MVSVAIADPLTNIVLASLHHGAIDRAPQKVIRRLPQILITIASATTDCITDHNFEAFACSLPLITNPIYIVDSP